LTYEEPSLGDTQKHPADDQTFIGRNGCGTDGDDSPRDHDSADPFTRCKVLHSDLHQRCLNPEQEHLRDVTREFKDDIWLFVSSGLNWGDMTYDEEHGYYEIISVTLEIEAFREIMPRLVIVECPTDMSEKFRISTMNVLTRYPSWFGHFDQLGKQLWLFSTYR